MWSTPPTLSATELTRLPPALHHRGEPTAWTRVTRPGLRLHSFLEGLVIEEQGDMLLADVPHGRLFRIDGRTLDWTVEFRYDGEPHGIALMPGRKALVTDYRRGLLELDLSSGDLTPRCTSHNTENFRGLSDLTIDPDGSVWFTDSGRTSLSDPTGRLFRLSSEGNLRCVLDNIPYPNGVAVSADGASVYVAATRANAVWRIARSLPDSGKPMAGLHVQLGGGLGPDGLAVAHDGTLAIAHAQAGCVWVLSASGEPLARIVTPGGLWTTSVRFVPRSLDLRIVDAQTGAIFQFDLTTSKVIA